MIARAALRCGIVQQPVYLLTAELFFHGTPIPRKHFKLAYNRRRRDIRAVRRILNHLLQTYQTVHTTWMPIEIDGKPIVMEPMASMQMLEPTERRDFISPGLRTANLLFQSPHLDPSPFFSIARRVRIGLIAPTHETGKSLFHWINGLSGQSHWPGVTTKVNQGMNSLIALSQNMKLTIEMGTFMSLANVEPASNNASTRESVQ